MKRHTPHQYGQCDKHKSKARSRVEKFKRSVDRQKIKYHDRVLRNKIACDERALATQRLKEGMRALRGMEYRMRFVTRRAIDHSPTITTAPQIYQPTDAVSHVNHDGVTCSTNTPF